MFGLVLMTACSDSASKFVGEWVDPTPKEEKKNGGNWLPEIRGTNDITIKKASESNRVEITSDLFGHGEKKDIFNVDGNNIIHPLGGVVYTLEGNELVKRGGKVKLVRKK